MGSEKRFWKEFMLDGITSWEGTGSIQAKENTEIPTTEGDELKGIMEDRNTAHLTAAPPGSGAGDTPKLPGVRDIHTRCRIKSGG